MNRRLTVSILGGSGALGSGLARRLVNAGYDVVIGSRQQDKAAATAATLARVREGANVRGMANRDAAAAGDVVFLTVPFSNHTGSVEEIKDVVQGKIFVDATVPLVPPRVARVTLPPDGSVAVTAQKILGPGVRVVSAFHNVAATHLHDAHQHDCDVFVFGNDKDARETIVKLAQDIGFKAWHAGAIENSVVAETLTSVLIFINKHYGIDGAGIKLIGADE